MQQHSVEDVLSRHGERLLHLAYSYLHNRADAEDILQDVLVQFLRKAPEFDSEEHERAWLLRVAINLCKNRLKVPWRSHCQLPEDYPGQGIPEDSIALLEAVSALPLKYREVVHLFYYEDAATAQIAALLNERESTVRKRLSRARDILRSTLRGGDFNGCL